mmetsp:Transcript_154/g.1188  ORF Transcript_154/g.1188 Transcript_154/m.1188 type:complete len:90 (+) Transcript_154:1364-1633(+)
MSKDEHPDHLDLCNGESIPDLPHLALLPLEPALVTRLNLQDIEFPVGNSGREQLVAATFITIGRAGQDIPEVVFFPVDTLGAYIENGCS